MNSFPVCKRVFILILSLSGGLVVVHPPVTLSSGLVKELVPVGLPWMVLGCPLAPNMLLDEACLGFGGCDRGKLQLFYPDSRGYLCYSVRIYVLVDSSVCK